MAPSLKNVAVVGASGNVGSSVVQALVKKGTFNVTAVIRTTSQSTSSTFPASVKVAKGDYSPEFLAETFKGIDALVVTIGAYALADQEGIVKAAAKAGVKRVIPSEFGSDTKSAAAVAAVPFFKVKLGELEKIKSVAAEYPHLKWTPVVTGPFFDFCLKPGYFGFDLANHKATLYDSGRGKFDTTTLATVGDAVAGILSHPDKYANEYVYVSSFKTSQAEIFAALKKASGTEDWQVEQKKSEDYMQQGREKDAKGLKEGIYDLIFASTFQEGNGADFSNSNKISNKELGLEAEDVETETKKVWEAVH